MLDFIKKIDWYRVGKTFVQVFGPVFILFLYDFGADGVVVVRDYIFGESGIIVVGTTALAILMNLPPKVENVEF